MNKQHLGLWEQFQEKWLTRRSLLRGAAGTALGAGFLRPQLIQGDGDQGEDERAANVGPNPIPGGVSPFAPYGVLIHHNPLRTPVASINDPSQITDFDGLVGLTHIRGGGTGPDATGAVTRLAFQADMGFSQGRYVGTDGQQHNGTFAFV